MNTTALKELRDAVAAGSWLPDVVASLPDLDANLTWRAYTGSLDAAKALHETLLPGWSATIQLEGLCYVHGFNGEHSATADNPARAWLLAILDALIAQGDG